MLGVSGNRILITGAGGFIGSHLVKRLATEEVQIGAIYRNKPHVEENILNLKRINVDILDYPNLNYEVRNFAPDFVFHLAAVRPQGRTWGAVQQAYQTNLMGTMNILRTLQDSGCQAVVLMGSTAEYGRGPAPYRENQALCPISPYGAAKAAASSLANLAGRLFDLPIVILRPTLVYGPGQGGHLFLAQLIKAILQGHTFDMTAGEQYRDFIYVTDVIEALWLAANSGLAKGGTYNIGSGSSFPLRDVAETVCQIIGRYDLLKVGAKPYSLEEQFAYCVDISLAKQILKWQPKTSLNQGLQATIKWYRQQLM